MVSILVSGSGDCFLSGSSFFLRSLSVFVQVLVPTSYSIYSVCSCSIMLGQSTMSATVLIRLVNIFVLALVSTRTFSSFSLFVFNIMFKSGIGTFNHFYFQIISILFMQVGKIQKLALLVLCKILASLGMKQDASFIITLSIAWA